MMEANVGVKAQCAIAGEAVVDALVDDGLAIGGVLTAVGTMAVGIAYVDCTPQCDGLFELEIIVGRETKITLITP